jgi:glutamyl-tRNA reductase
MPLVCLGLSHHTAPVEVRERHSFPASVMSEALTALRDYSAVREAVMLSTCNRLEIYAELSDYEEGVAQLKQFLQNFRHGSVSDIDSYLYTLLGNEVVDHLFRVASGLDSMLIGEAEILGQVKDAYIVAQQAKSVEKILHTLFREALNIGKRARSRTSISEDSVSVATAAVELARRHVGDIAACRVLVVGAGKMGMLAAKRFAEHNAKEIFVANRSLPRAEAVVTSLGRGIVVGMPQLAEALAESDIVVTSAGASSFLLTHEVVSRIMENRERPLFFVDIGVPRDVEPEVGRIAGVQLADIDALKHVVEDTLERRRTAIPRVEALVRDHVERFTAWYRARNAVPVISALTQKAEHIRAHEIDRLFNRLPQLSERERSLIVGTSLTIVSKLLHGALVRIREQAVTDQKSAALQALMLEDLFDLHSVLQTVTSES